MRWNKKVMLILMLALSLACVSTAKTASPTQTAGASTPQAGGASTPQTGSTNTLQAGSTNTPQTGGANTSQAGQSLVISVSTGGKTRDALVHIPSGYSSAAPVPLIVNFHGDGSTGKEQEALSGMSALADREGFLVAYPNGINQQWNTDAGPAGAPDRKFISDLVSQLRTDYRVNPKRIYATGMSNGGGMTNRVGCSMANIFAAIAPVEGGYIEGSACVPARPMPVMAFHGLTDLIVPYTGGVGKGAAKGITFTPIPDWAAAWANRDSCNATPQATHPDADVTRQEWTQCAGDASVILYSIDHHGHSWPGSKLRPAITSQAVNATAEMWRFFQAHPMP